MAAGVLEERPAAFTFGCAEQEAHIRELEILASQLALELEILKKVLGLYRQREGRSWRWPSRRNAPRCTLWTGRVQYTSRTYVERLGL